MERLHFLSGLPRSGSTLLAAILRQNPSVRAGMSSPVASLVLALQRQMSQENEAAPFITDEQRAGVLRGAIAGYYDVAAADRTVIDTNRLWCAKLPLLARLYPEAKVVACVRDVSWIMDSFEQLARANPLQPSRIYNFEAGSTVYSRTGALAASGGAVGFALDALREGFYAAEAQGRLMLLTYETLTADPTRALSAVVSFLELAPFRYDFERVTFDAEAFDQRIGAPGLHHVGQRVEARARKSVLPPGLFAQFAGDGFWRNGPNPHAVPVV